MRRTLPLAPVRGPMTFLNAWLFPERPFDVAIHAAEVVLHVDDEDCDAVRARRFSFRLRWSLPLPRSSLIILCS